MLNQSSSKLSEQLPDDSIKRGARSSNKDLSCSIHQTACTALPIGQRALFDRKLISLEFNTNAKDIFGISLSANSIKVQPLILALLW